MNKKIYIAATRGSFDYGWLQTNHSFSFGNYFDPEKNGFGRLLVLNDDVIQPGQGFDTHPHKNMEIITIPLSGKIEHIDSSGGKKIINPCEVQVMSAGRGIWHSEYNPSQKQICSLLQIWIEPDKINVEPRYDQKIYDINLRKNSFQLIASPNSEKSLFINQNAYLHLIELEKANNVEYKLNSEKNGIYIFVIKGRIEIDSDILSKRDAIGIWDTPGVNFKSKKNSYVLLIEVPMKNKTR